MTNKQEFVSEAVSAGPSSEKFDVARKIYALAAALGKDVISAESAARHADGVMFAKSVSYEVGKSEMSPEDAVEAVADRNASAFAATVRGIVATAVEKGCSAIGTFIGTRLGNPVLGGRIGAGVGRFLNQDIGECVERGAKKVVAFATQAWQATKRVVGKVVEKIFGFFS